MIARFALLGRGILRREIAHYYFISDKIVVRRLFGRTVTRDAYLELRQISLAVKKNGVGAVIQCWEGVVIQCHSITLAFS